MALNKRSRVITEGDARSANRAMLYPVGFKAADFGKPIVGIPAQCYFASGRGETRRNDRHAFRNTGRRRGAWLDGGDFGPRRMRGS